MLYQMSELINIGKLLYKNMNFSKILTWKVKYR